MKAPKLDEEGSPVIDKNGKPKMKLAPVTVLGLRSRGCRMPPLDPRAAGGAPAGRRRRGSLGPWLRRESFPHAAHDLRIGLEHDMMKRWVDDSGPVVQTVDLVATSHGGGHRCAAGELPESIARLIAIAD